MNSNNMCVWIDVLPQLVQILFIYFTSYVIPKLPQHHLLSEHLGVYSFQMSLCNRTSYYSSDPRFQQGE
jgi:hypothetical protein